MKSVIIYYSYSGNTKKVAELLREFLVQQGEVQQIELTGLDESKSFFVQAVRALSRKRAQIQSVSLDLSGFMI